MPKGNKLIQNFIFGKNIHQIFEHVVMRIICYHRGGGRAGGGKVGTALEWHTRSWLHQLFTGGKARASNGMGGKLFTN